MERQTLDRLILVTIFLLAASTAAMIYLSNINAVAFNNHLYESEYEKYDIRARFDPSVNLTNETQYLLEYLSKGTGEIQTTFFNAREKTHLVEVRDLFKLVSTLFQISAVIAAICALALAFLVAMQSANYSEHENREHYKKTLARFLVMTGAIACICALFFIFMMLTFSSSFIKFHELLFKTDTWMLDPATDNLIRMFPENFFFDLFMRIVSLSVIFAGILMAAGFLIRLGKPKFGHYAHNKK